MGVRNGVCSCTILGEPLVRTGWTLSELPLIVEEILKEVITPLRGSSSPRNFQSAGDGLAGSTAAVGVGPTQPLCLDRCALRFRADVFQRIGCTVGLAE